MRIYKVDLEPAESVDRLGWSVEEAAERIGIGRSSMCELIRAGTVQSVTIGRRRIIPEDSLRRYMAELMAAQAEHSATR